MATIVGYCISLKGHCVDVLAIIDCLSEGHNEKQKIPLFQHIKIVERATN